MIVTSLCNVSGTLNVHDIKWPRVCHVKAIVCEAMEKTKLQTILQKVFYFEYTVEIIKTLSFFVLCFTQPQIL